LYFQSNVAGFGVAILLRYMYSYIT